MTATSLATRPEPIVADKGLKRGAIGLVASTVMGIASTAPAYSLAATLGYLVQANGLHAPGVLLLAFVPMLCIAVAYEQLNRRDPDCGTTFTWAAKIFGPRTGWMGGWGIIAADVIVMANLGQVAGQYGFSLVGAPDRIATNANWDLLAGCIWIVLMTAVCYLGIEISSRTQFLLLAVEIVALFAFAIAALIKASTGHALKGGSHPHLGWLVPTHVGGFSGLSVGLLLAVFIYWGWDTSVSVNEETSDATRTPGRAAVLSTLLLLLTYALVSVAAEAYAGPDGLQAHQNDALSYLGTAVLGSAFGKLLVLMVLSSAAASTLTSILPTARTTLAMAAYGALPKSLARVSSTTASPTVSTVAMGVVSIAFFAGMTAAGADLYQDAIGSIGLVIAFYYGMTGFTAVWGLRREAFRSARSFVLAFLLPLIGSLTLLGLFLYGIKVYAAAPSDAAAGSYTTLGGIGAAAVIGVGSLLLGVVLMIVWEITARPYFRRETFAPETPADVLAFSKP